MAKTKFAKPTPKPKGYRLIFGHSDSKASDAVAAAQVQLDNHVNLGWKPINVSIAESATVYTRDEDGADVPVFGQSFDIVILLGS